MEQSLNFGVMALMHFAGTHDRGDSLLQFQLSRALSLIGDPWSVAFIPCHVLGEGPISHGGGEPWSLPKLHTFCLTVSLPPRICSVSTTCMAQC
jgi:hypothetical protein